MVITGDLTYLDSLYRYRTSAINVETAVRASMTRADVRADEETRRMVAALSRQQTVVTETKYGVSEDKTPVTAGTFLDRGIMFAMRGEYDMAIKDFDEAIRLKPDMAAAYMLRARALYASVSQVTGVGENFSGIITKATGGRVSEEQAQIYDRAIGDYTQAIRLEPNNAQAYLGRGIAYSNKGDFDRAIADNNEAIRLDPNYADAYYNRGTTYSNKNDYDRAIADYTQAIRLNPNLADAYNNRGIAYMNKNDYDRAIADYTEAIRLDPNYAYAYNNRAWTYAYDLKTNYNQALADINQALRLDPNNEGFYLDTRGWVYLGMRDYDKAIADFEAVLRIYPDEASTKEGLELARRRGR